ncbi:Hypothetical protein GbCGDNIH9_1743 [Granulibacter bethesdensis]|uniref:Polyphosphate kinase-2-related domain-containing protein n=1 Tax=Granulibacter bethesdensis TaxID=364410 RepID=A0AAC9K875_9PROT|nr:polyphosphate kinase 2 family protein [Granulibacter bethesdensis]APH55045.1 Hypothetical protein GbCGDNIH9_1743 [Granulibacter bethesdensis]APH62631.1 Hypothetical protein GbCGDNIH8_1743 [Granulibacter bethesdensis]
MNEAISETVRQFLMTCRIDNGREFRLADHDPDRKPEIDLSRQEITDYLTERTACLSDLQQRLYSSQSYGLLCVFQAMDTGGKDGTIRHVMSGVNPQGVQVRAFKQPGPEAIHHDFLWRVSLSLPQRGEIGIFNRSHYEEVLITRVHPHLLDKSGIPEELRGKPFWKNRLRDIRHFESYLGRQGIVIRKFFLHISKEEQRKRLLARLDDPTKHWKFSVDDIKERQYWNAYQRAYEKAIIGTARTAAPWFVIPANNKPMARLLVKEAIIETLEEINPQLPALNEEQKAALDEGRAALEDRSDTPQ